MNKTLPRRLTATLASIGLALVALPVAAPAANAVDACGLGQTCTGALEGALGASPYEIRMPEKFNGVVMLYSHGYRWSGPIPAALAGPAALDVAGNANYDQISQPAFTASFGSPVAYLANNNPEVAPSDAAAQNLLAQGFALAGTGYANQGFAVAEGVEAGENLIKHINSGAISGVKGIRVWGPSLGGLVTASLAERNPGKIQGALPMCGALAGPLDGFANGMTALFAWKQLIAPTLKVANYTPGLAGYAEALSDVGTIFTILRGVAANPVSPAGYPTAQANFLSGLMAGLPTKSPEYDGITLNPAVDTLGAPAANAAGYTPVSAGQSSAVAMLQNIASAAAFGTLGRYDLEMRARQFAQIPATESANFNDNVDVVYSRLLSPEQKGQFEDTINATTVIPTPLTTMLNKLDSSIGNTEVRYPANPKAVAYVESLPRPTGKYGVPTVILADTYDPVTPDGNTGILSDALRASYDESGSKAPYKVGTYYTIPPEDGWTKFEPGAKAPSAALSVAALGNSGVGHCRFTADQVGASLVALDGMVKAKNAKGVRAVNRGMWRVPGINYDGAYQPPAFKDPAATAR